MNLQQNADDQVTDVVAKEPKIEKTLCVRNVQELEKLISGEIQVIETFMVPRSICEKHNPDAPLKQLIPYVSFTAMDEVRGALMFMAYNRPVGGTEERLHGDTSIGFGGHMDDVADLKFAAETSGEIYPGHPYTKYNMSREDLVASIYNTARREVFEELGTDLFEQLGLKIENINMSIMDDSDPDAVGMVHTCISIMVDMPAEALINLKNALVASEREIQNLRVFGVMMDSVTKGDLERSMEGLSKALTEENQFERWSLRIALTRVVMTMNFIYANTSFGEIFTLAMQNAGKAQLAQQQALVEKAQAEADANLAKSTVLSDAQLEDKEEGERAFPPESTAEAPAENQTEA